MSYKIKRTRKHVKLADDRSRKPKREIVVVIPTAETPEHPIAALIGKFADEPQWNDYLDAVQECRQELEESTE